jgi:hypothetical protein
MRPGDRSTRVAENSRRLAEWCAAASEPSAECKLGLEPTRRRGDACSACKPRPDFEVNSEIARLIKLTAFKRAGICPYRVVVSHLLAGLALGPEAFRARSHRLRIDPVVEIKAARKRIRSVLYAAGLSRDDIEAILMSSDSTRWQALAAIATADRALENALTLFQSRIPMQTSRSPRGRTGALHNQAVARATALAWRQLTGRLPAKDNFRFHELVWAAIVSIFGHSVKKPNFESATKTAVDRIRRDEAGRS